MQRASYISRVFFYRWTGYSTLLAFQKLRHENDINDCNIEKICILASHYHNIISSRHVKGTSMWIFDLKFRMSFVCCVARAQHAYVEHMYVCKSNTIKKLIDEIKEKPIYA